MLKSDAVPTIHTVTPVHSTPGEARMDNFLSPSKPRGRTAYEERERCRVLGEMATNDTKPHSNRHVSPNDGKNEDGQVHQDVASQTDSRELKSRG